MFEKFSRELYKSGAFTCIQGEVEGEYIVSWAEEDGRLDHGNRLYKVCSSPDQLELLCECKHFEHSGMPCRHIIKVCHRVLHPPFIYYQK